MKVRFRTRIQELKVVNKALGADPQGPILEDQQTELNKLEPMHMLTSHQKNTYQNSLQGSGGRIGT